MPQRRKTGGKEIILWNEKVAEEVIQRRKQSYVMEGMWTPSGFFHIGNARPEVFTPYSVRRALEDKEQNVRQNFIIDDFDAVRKIPPSLNIPEKDHTKYLGFPCATAPSPLPGHQTWADAFVSELRRYFPEFGVELHFISAYESYKEGRFNELIRFTLEHAEEITKVWNAVSGSQKEETFIPVQVLCTSCKKIYYTKVIEFSAEKVTFNCSCGEEGTISPYNGNAKLHWRVHWVAHWIVQKVDFESGGKDHFSKGSSVDVGRALMEKVFRKTPPVQVPTEFIHIKGAKMSGSKGNVIRLGDWLQVASPELYRFLNFSYKPNSVIDLSLDDNSFVLLNDRFERAERIFYGNEQAENSRVERNLKKAYEFSVIGTIPSRMVQLPFSNSLMFAQLFNFETDLDDCLSKISNVVVLPDPLTKEEKIKIQNKLRRAKNWLNKYAPHEFKLLFSETLDPVLKKEVTPQIRNALKELTEKISLSQKADEVQQAVFDSAKKNDIPPKSLFRLLYRCMIGKSNGPKIGALVFAFGKEKVIQRLRELLE